MQSSDVVKLDDDVAPGGDKHGELSGNEERPLLIGSGGWCRTDGSDGWWGGA